MHHLSMPLRLLILICLLLVAAPVAFAQADPTISINDVTTIERDSEPFAAEFQISLSAASQKTISVTVSTQAGSATGDVDFGAGSIVLTFQPGQTSITLSVFVIGDTVVEGTEEFFLNLSNPVNATIADGQGVCTIIDDDALVLITQPSSQRGAALDSVSLTNEIFPIVSKLDFASDHRTRIAVFATGLKLAAGETASAVTATAEDSLGTVRPLTVEFVGNVPNFNWLTEVVLKLNDQITIAGDIKVKISLHGANSNTVLVGVKPQ